jgi:glycosyltransferase involved in cell wall biosynthesis
MGDSVNLIYFLPDYPLITTTFVDREITELRRLGFNIKIVASRCPRAELPLTPAQRDIQDEVLYLRPVSLTRLIVSHLYYLATAPLVALSTTFYLVRRPHPSIWSRFLTFLHIGKGIYAAFLLRNAEFEEIHVHFAFGNATSALVAARLLGKRYTMSVHAGSDLFEYPVLLPEKLSEARHIVTCTGFNKTHLDNLMNGQLEDKITFIPHGIDLSLYKPSTRKDTQTPRKPIILSVASLTERKGLIHLLNACKILRGRGYEFECKIVGDGKLRTVLMDAIKLPSLEDTCSLLGALSHDEVILLYDAATLFVLPCIQSSSGDMDGIPNVVAEAMAMKLPVVSTHISGVPELVENEVNGLLVESGNDLALADAISRLLDDPGMIETLGESARQHVHSAFDVKRNTEILATTLWK